MLAKAANKRKEATDTPLQEALEERELAWKKLKYMKKHGLKKRTTFLEALYSAREAAGKEKKAT